ncbi:hypothetical protein VTN00DRAFT_1733 [Thermoascus crustaceus]|uniref:uncharacterized protein n=1 Tax=Thermoascus crustaceus TaxID=5088 RepID=UPI003742BE99
MPPPTTRLNMITFVCGHQGPTPDCPIPHDISDMDPTTENCKNCHRWNIFNLDRFFAGSLNGRISIIDRQIKTIVSDYDLYGLRCREEIAQAYICLQRSKLLLEDVYRVRVLEDWDKYTQRWGDPRPDLENTYREEFQRLWNALYVPLSGYPSPDLVKKGLVRLQDMWDERGQRTGYPGPPLAFDLNMAFYQILDEIDD